MKYLVMLLMLFVLADPVLANQPNNNSACPEMYRTYLNGYDQGRSMSREQMLHFYFSCMSSNAVNNNEPLHRKLLQRMDNVERIRTVKT